MTEQTSNSSYSEDQINAFTQASSDSADCIYAILAKGTHEDDESRDYYPNKVVKSSRHYIQQVLPILQEVGADAALMSKLKDALEEADGFLRNVT